MPRRYQRKRNVSADIPAGAVYVGRPTKWGNPFKVGESIRSDDLRWKVIESLYGDAVRGFRSLKFGQQSVCDLYFEYIVNIPHLWLEARDELHGKDLVCWCKPDEPCHADLLLAIANDEDFGKTT